jgi:hypothetical protein
MNEVILHHLKKMGVKEKRKVETAQEEVMVKQ